jgi:ketosteroid isomerase-like protein
MKNLLFTFMLLGLVIYVHAQEFKNTDLQAMVNTERAFSTLARTANTRDAFLANLNNQSIVFNQYGHQNGLTKWTSEIADSAWLYWLPTYADISLSGDFGFTTGPWSYAAKKGNKKPDAFGEFITIWKKQADQSWKVALDIGIGHGEYPVDGHPVKTSAVKSLAAKGNAADFKKELQEIQRQFIQLANEDPTAAYTKHTSTELKFLRQGSMPILTIEGGVKDLGNLTFIVTDTAISSAGDMGYSFGVVVYPAGPGATPKKQNFVQIWKREKSGWRLVLDVIS